METPSSIIPDEPNYKAEAWQGYTLQELGAWVHLLAKRAGDRANKEKAQKDLHDAQSYLDMMQSMLNSILDTVLS